VVSVAYGVLIFWSCPTPNVMKTAVNFSECSVPAVVLTPECITANTTKAEMATGRIEMLVKGINSRKLTSWSWARNAAGGRETETANWMFSV